MESDLGEITRCYTITFERGSKHSAERLWRAITDSGEVSKWMGYVVRIDPKVGGEYYLDFAMDGDQVPGVVTFVDPGRALRWAWDRSTVEWTIEPDGAGSKYTFIHTGLTRRESEEEEGLAAGWHGFLDQLESHLEGMYPEKAETDARWERLKPVYKGQLEAALI